MCKYQGKKHFNLFLLLAFFTIHCANKFIAHDSCALCPLPVWHKTPNPFPSLVRNAPNFLLGTGALVSKPQHPEAAQSVRTRLASPTTSPIFAGKDHGFICLSSDEGEVMEKESKSSGPACMVKEGKVKGR